MTGEIFVMTRGDWVCKSCNRERPRRESTFVRKGSKCVKLEETIDTRYPMTYVLWVDSVTNESGTGWVLTSRLKSVHLI